MSLADDFLKEAQGAGGGAPAASGGLAGQFLADVAGHAPAINPTDEMSMLERLRAGTGMGMAKVGRAVGQAVGLVKQSDIDEANRLDASLNATTAGKVGNVLGQATAVLPAALIPGANTYLGATAVGAGVGGLTTEGGLKDRAIGAALGGVGGAAAKGLGDAAGMGLDWLASRRLAAQTANAGKDAAAAQARSAGYVIPPADTNPTMLNEVLNGISGKIKTAQTASARNQGVTNQLAGDALGVPTGQTLDLPTLNAIRQQAGQAYDAVSSAGTIRPGAAYDGALDQIVAPFKQAAAGFPNAKPPAIIGQIESLRSPQFDAGSAVSMIKQLRGEADKAYAGGDKATGAALKDAAGALENTIEDHLTGQGAAGADMLKSFRDARQLIAKTYSVQKALNPQTGDVAAPVLAAQLAKGRPLSGDLLTIGQSAQAFPKAMQALKEAPKQFSPLDFMTGIMAGTASGHPMAAALPILRPGIRMGLLSKPGQALGTPSYSAPVQGLLEGALQSQMLQQLAPGQMGLLASRPAGQ